MSLFDRLIASSLPLVPKPLVGHFARSYIAGETLEDQVRVVHSLNSEGFMAASGMLGEFVERREEAEAAAKEEGIPLPRQRFESVNQAPDALKKGKGHPASKR